MTADTLKDYNKQNLAQMAKEQGISGWHAMRKDQLIRALTVTRSSPSSRSKKLTRSAKKLPAARTKALAPRKQSASAAETAVAARRHARRPPALVRRWLYPTPWIMRVRKTGSSFWPATPTGCMHTGS